MGRRRGTTAFPVARIKKMMQADDDVGKIATATPVLVAKALECMMEAVLRDAAAVAVARRTKTVTPQHLKHSVAQHPTFDFLRPVLAGVAALDAEEATPARRPKRARREQTTSTTEEGVKGTPSPPASRPKRPRGPTPRGKRETKVETKLETSPVGGSPTPVADVRVPMTVGRKEENEEEDYDEAEDDEEMQDATTPAASADMSQTLPAAGASGSLPAAFASAPMQMHPAPLSATLPASTAMQTQTAFAPPQAQPASAPSLPSPEPHPASAPIPSLSPASTLPTVASAAMPPSTLPPLAGPLQPIAGLGSPPRTDAYMPRMPAPLVLQEQPGLDRPRPPETAAAFGCEAEGDPQRAPQQQQKVKAAERVSVRALLS